MSLDSEVPPSKYLSSESRDTTKMLKSLATKSSSASNGQSTSQKIKSIVNKVQNYQEELEEMDKNYQLGLAEMDNNCQEGLMGMGKKIDIIANKVHEGLERLDSQIKVVEAKTLTPDEMKEMKAELYTKLEAITAATEAATNAVTTAHIPNTEKIKEVDVAVIEMFKKMTYIESIVLNFSKSYYEINDKDLKNLITKQSAVEKVSVTSNADNRTKNNESISQTATNVTPNSSLNKPLPIPIQTPMSDKATKEQQLRGGTPSYSIRTRTPQTHSIDYEI